MFITDFGIFVTAPVRAGSRQCRLFFLGRGELIFAYAAHRTLKIIRKVLELGSGLDAGLEIAEILIIDISADITYKFCP